MTYPNTLIFVDFPSTEPTASAAFYEAVFGWEVEPRPENVFHRIVPGQNFQVDDGSQGPTGNLHMGIFNVANARPHPDPDGVEPRTVATDGHSARVWILVSEDDSIDRILDRSHVPGRDAVVAGPLLGRVQRVQRGVPRPVGQHVRAVDQGWRQSRDPRGVDP